MRQVRRVTRTTRAALRRPKRPSWAVRLRLAALGVLGLGLVGYGLEAAWRSSWREQLHADLVDGFVARTAAAGFVVTRIYSEGRQLTAEQELVRALEPYYGKPILSVDLDRIKVQLEGLPWVRLASVSRRLPDTLWVTVDEHRPVARWLEGARQHLVTDAGEVVRGADARPFRHLPLLFGADAPERAGEVLRLIALEPILSDRVTGARLVSKRRWDVYLDGRIEVRLPEEAPEAAWHRLAVEQRASAVLGRAITGIDLRNPDWLTVQIADEAIQPAEDPGA